MSERSSNVVPARGARHLGLLWSAAVAVAALGVELLFDRQPGLNWLLWTLLAAGGMAVFGVHAHGRLRGARLVPLALAVLVAATAAVTANEALNALAVPMVALLLGVGMLVSADPDLSRVAPRLLAWTPLVAPVRAAAESLRRVSESIDLLGRRGSVPLVRGLVMTLPVVLFLALLLSGADPLFAAAREAVKDALLGGLDAPRVVFFTFLLVVSLGAYGVTLAGVPVMVPGAILPPLRARVGVTERRMLLGSVVGLFTLWMLFQLSYLFGNAPAAAGSGVTFAEYARRGFGELTVAAIACGAMVLALELRGARDRISTVLELVLVAQLLVLLASAFRRVLLYESAYGFTVARVWAQAFMLALVVGLVVLAWELRRGVDLGRLTRAAALTAIATFAGLALWNHEAWIVERNVERFATGGELDVVYLARLSDDARPATIAALPRLAEPERSRLRACLTIHGASSAAADSWVELNLRRSRARAAFERSGLEPMPTGAAGWEGQRALCQGTPRIAGSAPAPGAPASPAPGGAAPPGR